MSSRLIIGIEPFLTIAVSTSRIARPEISVRTLVALQRKDYTFDSEVLEELGPSDGPAFIAVDHRYLGFKRLELATLVHARGVSLEGVIGMHAVIGEGARISPTAYIGEGAVIGPGAVIGDHACVGARSVVGPGAVLGTAVWLDPAVVVGAGAKVETQTALGAGVIVQDGAQIGELCVLTIPGLIRGEVRSRTYLHPAFSEPIRIFG